MNYKIEGMDYIANDDYVFVNKSNGATCKIMSLPENDNIENYDVILEPKEVEETPQDNEKIKQLLDKGFTLGQIESILEVE